MEKEARCLLFFLIVSIIGCSCNPYDNDEKINKLSNIQSAFEFYDWLIKESANFYDSGKGHWGQDKFGYRNMLNECFLRYDGYQLILKTNYSARYDIKQVLSDITSYYLQIADTIGTGVWSFPAEINHPEIGKKMKFEIFEGNSKNGWILELSGLMGSKAGIYYTHGQVLADISKSYLRFGNNNLLPYIKNGANWIVEKKYNYGNINYFAAALKGLAYSYTITKDTEVKKQALTYLSLILGSQNSNGSFGSEHDQEAGYHGITLSCVAVARKYLPEKELPSNIDEKIMIAISYLRDLQDIATEDRAGFVVQAWYYISCLADDKIIPNLSSLDWAAYDKSIQICINKKQSIIDIKEKNNYRYQKEIQTASLLGSTIAKYYFGIKEKY